MIRLKSAEEVEIIKEGAQILGKAHAEVARAIRPGVKTKELDKIAIEGKKRLQNNIAIFPVR